MTKTSMRPSPGSVAVVGMGLAAPGVSDPQDFWRVLHADTNTLTGADYINVDNWFSADRSAPDKSYGRFSGFLGTYIPHPRLAAEQSQGLWAGADRTMLLLRHSLLHAMDQTTVRAGDRCGAYIGTQPGGLALEDAILLAVARNFGQSQVPAELTSRYRYAPTQPADAFPDRMLRMACRGLLPHDSDLLVVDTACSSSLYAIDLGVKSLLANERDVVFCGGAITGSRRDLVLFSKVQGLSTNGEVRAFDKDAVGVLFSDAAAVVALKLLDRAHADGDEILGVLGGFGGSADGAGSVMAGSPIGQRMALDRARAVNAIDSADVQWIVAHGTGTKLGDDVELEALGGATGSGEVLCTSNKPLIGHGAWAAGAINVIHAVLAIQYGEIPAERYFTGMPEDTRAHGITVPTAPVRWPARADTRRLAGVCAYGFGGTNAHLLVQAPDPDGDPLRSATEAAAGHANDPMVLVGKAVQFPGTESSEEITRWLQEETSPPPQSFGTDYPLPPFQELRMPPVSARSIDRTHLMALGAVGNFVAHNGEMWKELRERTGVITGHTGPTRCMAEYTIRVGADELRAALANTDNVTDLDAKRLDDELAALSERLPPANDRSMTGQLPNIISSMVVNRYRLNGLAMNVDCGRSSTQGALHVAERYLGTGELDFALVIGLNGNSTPLMSELSGTPADELAEGAVLLALTRQSVAARNDWPVLAKIRTAAAHTGTHAGTTGATGRSYLGADGALAVLRSLDGQPNTTVLDNPDPAPRVEIEPNPLRATVGTPLPDRSVVVLRRAEPHRSGEPTPAIRPATLVLTHSAQLARQLTPLASVMNSRLLCTDPTAAGHGAMTIANGAGPQAAVADAVAALGTDLQHVLVVASSRTPEPGWPAPPAPELLALQECTLAAAAALGDDPPQHSTITALLLDPLHRDTVHPHLTLVTGFLRSLAHELPDNRVLGVVTDATLETALAQLGEESGYMRERTIIRYRQGLRYLEQLCAAPIPETRRTGPLPWQEGPVIVATGGARGATATVVTALAERVRPSLWLLGTTPVDEVPDDLLNVADHDLTAKRAEFLSRARRLDPTAPIIAANKRFDALLRAREIRRNLRTLESLCGAENVHYRVCDLRDREQVALTAKAVYTQHGRIDLLIHGAGRIRSGRVAHKSLTDFREIRDIKVAGYHHLKEAFADPAPALWCNFGSGNALLGCAGDTDYVAANEYLCAAAAYTDSNEFTPAWGLWAETGMVHGLAEQISREYGLVGISNNDGAALMLSELAVPQPLDAVPLYGIANAWAQHPEPAGPLLSGPDTATGSGIWTWRPDPVRDSYLNEHLIERRPVLPAVMMLAMAAEAAVRLHPPLQVTGFSALQIDAPVYADVAAAECRIAAETVGSGVIRVQVRSDVVTPDGRVLVHDRMHCRVDVHVGELAPPPLAPIVPDMPELAEDPAVRPDVSAQLSGVWRTMHRPRSDRAGAAARCRPNPEPHSVFARLPIPALLLDSTLRLFGYPPLADGHQIMAVPRAAERIDFYTADTDVLLAERYPAGLQLSYEVAKQKAIAAADDGTILLAITGLDIHTVSVIPKDIPNQEWQS